MAYTHIELDVSRSGVAMVLLNRPDKRNALNIEMINELADVFETLSKATEVRLVMLRGAGPSFCAGVDLEWMQAARVFTQHDNEEDAFALAEMLRKLYELPQVTVAQLHGAVMAGACGLAAACDIAIARTGAQFGFTEVRLGILPATISPYVVGAIGARWTRALFVTGERFDAELAHRIGLVHHVVADEAAMDALTEIIAEHVFASSPLAIAEAKDLIEEVSGREIDHALSRFTARRLAAVRVSRDGQEGLAAFLEKRKPDWAK